MHYFVIPYTTNVWLIFIKINFLLFFQPFTDINNSDAFILALWMLGSSNNYFWIRNQLGEIFQEISLFFSSVGDKCVSILIAYFFVKVCSQILTKTIKKTPFISGAFSNRMGRTMRIELTSVWFTARCVNHFTTFAKSRLDNARDSLVKN